MPPLRTLASPITISGRGVFTARDTTLTLHPARSGRGITFAHAGRTFHASAAHLDRRPAHPAFAAAPARHTALAAAADAPPIFTVEHLLAALAGLGITDAHITIDTPANPSASPAQAPAAAPAPAEIPIFDGSALPFVRAIETAGLASIPATLDPIRPRAPIHLQDGQASITIEPTDLPHPTYHYILDYGPTAPAPLRRTTVTWQGDPEDFAGRIAPARTFSLAHEVQALQSLGLFKDFSPRDLLVLSPDGTPIDNAWRRPDEPALHKLLDLIGDLSLAGAPILATITATRSGHALNHQAAKALANLPAAP